MNTYSVRVKCVIVLEKTIEIEAESEGRAYEAAEDAANNTSWFSQYELAPDVEETGENIEAVDVSLDEGEEPDEEV